MQAFHGPERHRRVGQCRCTNPCRQDAVAVARDQGDAERVLEPGHGLAEARLGNAEGFRSRRETAGFDDTGKGAELA